METIRRYFLEVAYKGTNYHGWQVQPNAQTVQEAINKALSTILRKEVDTMGSGRTDTGVHGKQQFLHFDWKGELDKGLFLKKTNAVLPKDISLYDLREVHPDAHARFDAEWRSYEYHISLRKNPFEETLSWHCFYQLDIAKMNDAADLLLSHRDFECFSKVKTEVNHFECEIKTAFWEQKDQHLVFHITANRFLRGMVRAIVGTLVEVGKGQLDLTGFQRILESKDRGKAGVAAPPHGLFLSKVTYPEKIFI
ncbi:tRNA pseudouridine(38-40) synthase TruA [Echinicola vietnamensis]|uniref:tRNA pseudouridine synthase A n=1 Tax=Echinicola vietnamensis (strain DSM 17526 / LMG 23754 / KMM 6221) TaxID=926556 RepID=L0FY90_ECHVK|nr:tRNA pseudouridine(38-40) synthase TruA [Echinicola vietnamensis]AGA77993.1 pseudouridylate synthase I [Echinicola vietnamensis DSM 17526]